MLDNQHLIADIIAKYAQRQVLTESEKKELAEWCAQSRVHALVPEIMRDQPWLDKDPAGAVSVPSDAMWNDIATKIGSEKAPVQARDKTRLYYIAAAVVIGLFLGGWLFRPPASKNDLAIITPVKTSLTINSGHTILTRADGSLVDLNKLDAGASVAINDKLSIRKDNDASFTEVGQPTQVQQKIKAGTDRKIALQFLDKSSIELKAGSEYTYTTLRGGPPDTLKGAGKFDLAKDKQKARIIWISTDVRVEVLGTCFDVGMAKRGEPVVYLKTGEIKVVGTKGSIVLKPGQQVVVKEGQPRKEDPHLFDLKNVPLKKALQKIAAYYELTIENRENLEGHPVSGIEPYRATPDPNDLLDQLNIVECHEVYLHVEERRLVVSRN